MAVSVKTISLSIEVGTLLRRRKPERIRTPRRTRDVDELLSALDAPQGRVPLVPDTNVYIADAAGNLPSEVEELLDRSLLFHCSVCLAELATGVANGDPKHPGWFATRDHYVEIMTAIPASRVLTPDRNVWIDAGLLSGTLARTQGLQPFQRKEMLNDALILLTAARAGLSVLTSNRNEFDLLQQLAPETRFYHY